MTIIKLFEEFKSSDVDERILSHMTSYDYNSLPIECKKSLMIWNIYHGDGEFLQGDYGKLDLNDFDWVNDERISKMSNEFGENFAKKYGHTYKYGLVPSELIKEKMSNIIKNNDDFFGTNFDQWHKRYQSTNKNDFGDSILPIIVDFNNDYGWVEDGWHRLSSYMKKELETIPILDIVV